MNEYSNQEIQLLKQLAEAGLLERLYKDALTGLVAQALQGDITLDEGKAEMSVHAVAEGRMQQVLNSLVK